MMHTEVTVGISQPAMKFLRRTHLIVNYVVLGSRSVALISDSLLIPIVEEVRPVLDIITKMFPV